MKKRIDNRTPLKNLHDDQDFIYTVNEMEVDADGRQVVKQRKDPGRPSVFIREFVYSISRSELSMKDTTHGADVIRATMGDPGYVDLYFNDFEWLKGAIEKHGVKLYGVNVQVLLQALRPSRNGGRVEDVAEEAVPTMDGAKAPDEEAASVE